VNESNGTKILALENTMVLGLKLNSWKSSLNMKMSENSKKRNLALRNLKT
jgi:hypothetical protein